MTEPILPSASHRISEVLERWPQTLSVFLRRRMACPGCAMAPFMTLGEAAACYGQPVEELVAEVRRAVDGTVPAGPFPPPLPHRKASVP